MIQIDREFQALIPPLTQEEFDGLERNIIENGCLDALKVWGNILVDGHNRYAICQKYGINFKTQSIAFADRNAAILWIIRNQLDRRNIADFVRYELSERHAAILKEQGRQKQLSKLKQNLSVLPIIGKTEGIEEKGHNTQEILAGSLGWSKGKVSQAKIVKEKAPEPVKEALRKGEMSINEAYKQVKREEQQEARKQVALSLEQPTKQVIDLSTLPQVYRVVYADPPWSYGNDHTQAMPGSTRPEDHYVAMSTADICKLPVKGLTIDNAVLFLWGTSPLLEDALQVIQAWEFKYKTTFIWDKIKHNFGHYNSVRHEFLFVATKGSCTPDNKTLFDSVVSIERTEHSAKPEKFREIIDELYPHGNRIELFARAEIKGWDTWGNQTHK